MKDPALAFVICQESMNNLTDAVTHAWNEYLQHGHPSRGEQTPYEMFLEAVEAPMLAATLQFTRGNQTRAANLMVMHRNTLRSKIRSYSLGPDPKQIAQQTLFDELLQAKEDLDWLVFYGASVRHNRDGEDCWVVDADGKPYSSQWFPNVTAAVAHAREEQHRRNQEAY